MSHETSFLLPSVNQKAYLTKNMSKRCGTETFNVLAVEKEIPNYTATISDHRPVMMRLHFGADSEESAMLVLRNP